jgi:predicted aspartyl protease
MRLTACFAVSLLLPAAQAQPEGLVPEGTLARHRESFGGQAALASGDLLLEGTLEANGPPQPLRIYIRRQPFGYREETGAGERAAVFLSDGDHAWTIRGGRTELARGQAAISLLEFAFVARLGYLDPGRIDAWQSQQVTMWSVPGSPTGIAGGQGCWPARVRTAAGTTAAYLFGADDGRLHGIAQEGVAQPRWTRFGGWQTFGPWTLPTLRADGARDHPIVEWQRLRRVQTGLAHDPALFPPPPLPEHGGDPRPTPLAIVPTPVPGSGLLVVREVGLNDGKTRYPALFDTGISELGVAADLAARLRLAATGAERVATPAGSVTMGAAWLDAVELAGARLVQIVARTATFPSVIELEPANQPVVHLGGPRVMAAAPVVDLEHGQLFLGGSLPSSSPPAAGAARPVSIAVHGVGSESALLTVDVGVDSAPGRARAMVDTGFPMVLRLTPASLQSLGLPRDRETWVRRGGLPVAIGGVGGGVADDLIVQVEAVTLGPIVYERPWVLVSFAGDADDAGAFSLLGTGALLPFARAAFDPRAHRLDLTPGAGVLSSATGAPRVPSPGAWLGCGLLAPGWDTVVGKTDLPCVAVVAPGSPAAKAGLRVADLVEAIDGEPVRGMPMPVVCRKFWLAAGATLTVGVRRNGESQLVAIRLP